MKRKDFLNSIGIGAAFVLTAGCLGGCSKDKTSPNNPTTNPTGNGGIDFTLDLNNASNSDLANNGGYVLMNGVVVARDNSGNYIAATQTCSHEGFNDVVLANNKWTCTRHGAVFSLNGQGENANGSAGLTIYNTELDGTMLRVFE